MNIKIRRATQDDLDIIWLASGQGNSDDSEKASFDPHEAEWEMRHYAEGWMRPGDAGVVAIDSDTGEGIGAAWIRLFPPEDPAYGYVDEHTPEAAVALALDYRNKGIGPRLMDALIDIARGEGLAQICLSVAADNARARKLYERKAFERSTRSTAPSPCC